jgi:hypothetical protein
MIRLLPNMPAGVLGFEAVDDVEKEDYEDLNVPEIDQTIAGRRRHLTQLGVPARRSPRRIRR